MMDSLDLKSHSEMTNVVGSTRSLYAKINAILTRCAVLMLNDKDQSIFEPIESQSMLYGCEDSHGITRIIAVCLPLKTINMTNLM